MPISLRFTSRRNAHQHLLKHVLRVTESRGEADDPERWDALIGDPPLVASIERRRASALQALRAIPGCAVRSTTADAPCASCTDSAAHARADARLAPTLRSYLGVARGAIQWAVANPGPRGPRYLAFRDRRGTKLELWSHQHVRVNAMLDRGAGEVAVVSCYRDASNHSFGKRALELARARAGHSRAGSLVDLGALEPELRTLLIEEA